MKTGKGEELRYYGKWGNPRKRLFLVEITHHVSCALTDHFKMSFTDWFHIVYKLQMDLTAADVNLFSFLSVNGINKGKETLLNAIYINIWGRRCAGPGEMSRAWNRSGCIAGLSNDDVAKLAPAIMEEFNSSSRSCLLSLFISKWNEKNS